MSDPDVKTAIENMPFFLESLAARFEDKKCPTLPKLCRGVATEIERLQARNELLELFLQGEGYRFCDIPACNCGSWHKALKEQGAL